MDTVARSVLSFVAAGALASACTIGDYSTGSDGGADGGTAQTDAERVFSVPAGKPNTGMLTGIWESAQPEKQQNLESTSRFEFRASFVIAAARCTLPGVTPVVVGGRAPASVSADVIQIEQAISDAKMMNDGTECGVSASAGVLPACPATTPSSQWTTCFDLSGGGLTMYSNGTPTTFVKISD